MCLEFPPSAYNKKGKKVFKAVTHALREDGVYIEAGENDNLIIQKLEANPDALGIFGFSFLDQNSDKVHGSIVEAGSLRLKILLIKVTQFHARCIFTLKRLI